MRDSCAHVLNVELFPTILISALQVGGRITYLNHQPYSAVSELQHCTFFDHARLESRSNLWARSSAASSKGTADKVPGPKNSPIAFMAAPTSSETHQRFGERRARGGT